MFSYLVSAIHQIVKKVFLSEQSKEIEENNRMGKTRDLFKKTKDTKGTFYAKMGSIKDRNGRDLTEAGDIKKRWQNTSLVSGYVMEEKEDGGRGRGENRVNENLGPFLEWFLER